MYMYTARLDQAMMCMHAPDAVHTIRIVIW